MKYKLSDICSIQQGRNVSSSEFNQEGQYIYLNLKDVVDIPQIYTRTNIDINSRYLVESGDILFSIRGKFNAFKLPKNLDKPIIASSMFAILRLITDNVLPIYLLWYLNHPSIQNILRQASPANSRMPFLSIQHLKNLEIEIPKRKKQQYIIDIYNLHQQEMVLYNKISELKKQYIQTTLLNSIQQ